ncbi:MAG: hypothetical protein HYV29_02620 [Ignavibacteriales bacterium]|nr:hypothetical protein [Ignavibacteriales bacterium]
MHRPYPYYFLISCCFLVAFADDEAGRKPKSLTQFTHEVWQTDDGLPQNSVNCIVQTPDGYLWMGTQEGVVRFDGVQFTLFDKRNTPQIKNNYISALYVDRDGTLWIGTYDGGLIRYTNNSFRATTGIKKFENTHIRTIFEDKSGGMWIAVRGRGVLRIDTLRHLSFDTTNGLLQNEVWAFAEDAKGRIWMATEGGVSIYDKGVFRNVTKKEGLISNNINTLTPAPNNRMWIGTNQGVMRVPIDPDDSLQFEKFTVNDGLPHRIVYTTFLDTKGQLWIGTRNGIALWNKGTISSFTVDDGLSYDHVMAIFVDREENVWIGTDGGGLNVLRDGLFTTFTTKEGIPSNVIWTVYEDSDGQLWIGTDKGLVCMNGDRTKILSLYTKKDGLYDNEIYSVAVDRRGVIWAATVNGVNIIEKGKVKRVEPLSLTYNQITAHVFADSKDRVWIATTGNGLLQYVNGTLSKQYKEKDGLASSYINAIAEDRHGNIWVGTDGGGVSVISDTGIVTYSVSNGLSSNFVHTIYHDENDGTWVGTFGGGVNRIKEGTVSSITTAQGLFDDALFQILKDDYGRMWFTSNKGIFQVSLDELNECADGRTGQIHSSTYGTEDGLKSVECNGGVQPAGWKASDGSLWFPTSGGVAMIHPRNIATNQQPPLVVIEEMIVDNNQFDLAHDIAVSPGRERFEFRFTGLSFVNPKKVRFKVKLEGYDKGWDDVGTRRASDGVWNETGASVTFTHQAYFYETNIFYVSIGVFLLLAWYSFYKYRIRTIERRQQELESVVTMQTRDLREEQQKTERLLFESEQQKKIAEKANEMKTQLLDMVAHDLKSPLISMSGLAKEIKQTVRLEGRAAEYLSMIQGGTDRLVSLINDLLNISAIESGELHFNMERLNIVEVAGMTVDAFQLQARQKNQTLLFLPKATMEIFVFADTARLQEAIENLISNAVKYSPLGAEIRVGIDRLNTKVRFWVKDNGPGLSDDDKNRIFKKFQILSAKPTGDEIATGLGLAIVKEIIVAHKGSVFVESEPDKGSTFVIELDAV